MITLLLTFLYCQLTVLASFSGCAFMMFLVSELCVCACTHMHICICVCFGNIKNVKQSTCITTKLC